MARAGGFAALVDGAGFIGPVVVLIVAFILIARDELRTLGRFVLRVLKGDRAA
jgi:Sec-independent protein translocase protein TatA